MYYGRDFSFSKMRVWSTIRCIYEIPHHEFYSYEAKYIDENGGIILYLRQEGRNIGIINKIKAYQLQELGLDTVEANLQLGLPADDRDFNVAIEILNILGVKKINLLTNNPEKLSFVEKSNIQLVKRIPLNIKANHINKSYLETKKSYFGHQLEEALSSI